MVHRRPVILRLQERTKNRRVGHGREGLLVGPRFGERPARRGAIYCAGHMGPTCSSSTINHSEHMAIDDCGFSTGEINGEQLFDLLSSPQRQLNVAPRIRREILMKSQPSFGVLDLDYTDFTPTPKKSSLRISPAALDRASITVGNLNAFSRHRSSSVTTLGQQWRTAITRDAICIARRAGGVRWYQSESYAQLEPTEKGFMSGLLGGVMCKLVAERVFNVSIFGHIEYFDGSILPNGSRPDFIGFVKGRQNDAVIVESKGRSSPFGRSSKQVDAAKRQTQTVRSVSGCNITERYVQYTHPTGDGAIRASLFDPPGVDSGDLSGLENEESPINLTPYYRPLASAIQHFDPIVQDVADFPYRVAFDDVNKVIIGIPEHAYVASFSDNSFISLNESIEVPKVSDLEEQWSGGFEHVPWPDDHIVRADSGPDGIVVVGAYPNDSNHLRLGHGEAQVEEVPLNFETRW